MIFNIRFSGWASRAAVINHGDRAGTDNGGGNHVHILRGVRVLVNADACLRRLSSCALQDVHVSAILLIEGHDTHPIDIERALENDDSKDARKRDPPKAHIVVQQWIDSGGLSLRSPSTFLRPASR